MILDAPLGRLDLERTMEEWISQTLVDGIRDGGQSCNDALVLEISTSKPKTMSATYGRIRDLAILHGDVEVNPD